MPTVAPTTEPPLSALKLSILAGLIVLIGPLSLSLYTPAMPTIGAALGADEGTMKQSITVYLLGFTLCQLVCGPLSDRFGRRPVILGFTLVYVAGCAVILIGQTPGALILGRTIQGIGACAGPALSRAMIRDCYHGNRGASLMANVAMILSAGPGLAPLIGALLLDMSGWQSVFVSMAVYGLFLVVLVAAFTPETNRRPNPDALNFGPMLRNYAKIGSDPRFIRLSMAVGSTLGGIFTFSAILPYVLIDQVGLGPVEFGIGIGLSALAFLGGSIAANRLIGPVGPATLVTVGLVIVLISALQMSIGIAVFGPSVLTTLGPIYLWAVGTALVMPGGTMGALNPFGRIAGSAAALLGFVQMGMGAAASFAAGLVGDAVRAEIWVPLGLIVLAIVVYVALAGAAERADLIAAEVPAAE